MKLKRIKIIIASGSDFELLLLKFIRQQNFYQSNNILNDKNTLIDLILVSEDLIYEICDPIECIFKKSIHHSPIVIDLGIIEFYNSNADNFAVFTFDFKKANFIGLNNLLLSSDWTTLLSNMDLIAMYDKFLSILQNAMNRFIPR